jgi:metal-responsive CopG/Arc/MetJ family transcriptional regulator
VFVGEYIRKASMKKVAVINVRLPDEIISWLDKLVDKKIFNSRSEAVREFSRDYLLKHRGAK